MKTLLALMALVILSGCSSNPTGGDKADPQDNARKPVPSSFRLYLAQEPTDSLNSILAVDGIYHPIDPGQNWFAGATIPWDTITAYLDLPTGSNFSVTIVDMQTATLEYSRAGYADAGVLTIIWAGTDPNGYPVRPGEYLITANAGYYVGYLWIRLIPSAN